MKKILLKGYFEKNLGDDLFLKIITERYPKICFELYSQYDYRKILTTKNVKCYSRMTLFGALKLLKKLFWGVDYQLEDFKKYDLIVKIGGSLFIEPSNFDYQVYRQKVLRNKIPNYIIGANFGPYHSDGFLKFYREEYFPKVYDVCFRDNYSFNLISNTNIRKAADIIFGLNLGDVEITNRKRVIISVVNCEKGSLKIDKETYYQKLSDSIRFFKQKGYEVLLASFSKAEGDEVAVNDLLRKNSNLNIEKYFYRGNLSEALSILADSQIIIGGRFHANILGMLMKKTVIPVAYSDKTLNVLHDMNFKGKYFDLRNIETFDITSLTEDDLNYKIDISEQILDSENHFRELDKILSKGV